MYIVDKAERKPFEFQLDGEVYAVPSIASFNLEQVKAFKDAAKEYAGRDFDFALWLIDTHFPEDARKAVQGLNVAQLTNLIAAYVIEARESLGESKA